ncbi:hypothetical protein GGF32_007867, partial [Allomyces javanicus]
MYSLQLIECETFAGSQRVIMPSLNKCLIDRTVVPKDLTTLIDASMLDELRVVVGDPMAMFNMQ